TARSQKAALEAQLAQAEAAGLPPEEIEKIKAGIAAANSGIAEAETGLGKINDGIAQAEAGKKQAQAGLEKADAGYKELDKQKKKINQGEEELNAEEAKADEEFAKAQKELDDAKDKLDEAQEKIDDMETGNSYALSRTQNAGYSSFDSNSSIVSNIAKIFPVFFFLIAALVCMTTMTRMVDEQRTQIGILKALGYSNAAIVGKYMFYSGSAALLGSVVGYFIGIKVFPMAIWNAYTMMYDFTDKVEYVVDPKLGLISLAAALICSMGATWVSIAADFKVAPSDLIRPKTPPAGKRILMERIKPLWNRIGFLYKVSIRNIFRDKKRFLMMVIGVSGCTALLIAGMGIRTTISRVADHQYNEISLYDFTVMFSKDMNENRRGDFMKDMEEAGLKDENVKFMYQGEMTLTTGQKSSMDITCVSVSEDNFSRFVNLHDKNGELAFPGQGEAIIVSKLQHDYEINVGDTITLRKDYREMKLKVAGVADNYVYDTIYMSNETYEQGMGKKGDIKAAYVKLGDGATEDEIRSAATIAANYENTAAVQVNADVKDNVSKMMKSLDAVVYVVILSAALLAFIVLYNLTNINITERIREIATIKVLGFRGLEVSQYVFRENLFLTAIAAVVGIPMGKWLLKFVIDNIVVKMIYFEPRLTNTDIILSVVLTFVFAFFVNLVMIKRLANISMTESLKSVE
ncbi:MAG: FtsX-like permease family protein, partial [Mogibacterium sp.]|nr:FtsX-like permease family protein [Mogibacterium sp.]